jgi:hypothetical protein
MVPCLNESPAWIAALARIALSDSEKGSERFSGYKSQP